jgi:hypothetical protein
MMAKTSVLLRPIALPHALCFLVSQMEVVLENRPQEIEESAAEA